MCLAFFNELRKAQTEVYKMFDLKKIRKEQSFFFFFQYKNSSPKTEIRGASFKINTAYREAVKLVATS